MFLKLLSIAFLLSGNPEKDTIITEADMIGKWHIKYCYENKKLNSCENCRKENADFTYAFKKKVFSEVSDDTTVLVPDRRYGSWSIVNNVLVENTSQNLNGKVVNYIHEYKLIKISKDKYFVSTIEDNKPLYIYYCRDQNLQD